jgi:hypothetical protein
MIEWQELSFIIIFELPTDSQLSVCYFKMTNENSSRKITDI